MAQVVDLTQIENTPLSIAEDEAVEEAGEEQVDLANLETPMIHYGYAMVKIVGLRYYSGSIHAAEMLHLLREPSNPYDSNAVRVDNLDDAQIGHVNRYSAVHLARILDNSQGKVRVDPMVPPGRRGKKNQFSVMIRMDFYGEYEMFDTFRSHLLSLGLMRSEVFSDVPPRSLDPSIVPGVSEMLGSEWQVAVPEVRVTREEWKKKFDSQDEIDGFCDRMATEVKSMDFEVEGEGWPLKAKLFPHQRQGIAWMLKQELQSDTYLSPLWKEIQEGGGPVYHSYVTNYSYRQRPVPSRGGLLSDDMGLGKTIQVIGLMVANPPCKVSWGTKIVIKGKADPSVGSTADGGEEQDEAHQRNTTLVVCPLSVMPNWSGQIASHLLSDGLDSTLSVYSYYGSNRERDPKILEQYDVVLTTYATLSSEYSNDDDGQNSQPRKKRKTTSHGLLNCKFWRVVLDEGHQIRNPRTKVFKAVKVLDARYRWVLTGTPISNRLSDMGSLLSFLRVEPLTDMKVFNQAVVRPVERSDETGLSRLRAIVSTVCLRRTKEKVPELTESLPKKKMELVRVEMTKNQRELYDIYYKAAKAAFAAAMSSGTESMAKNFGSILEIILRLRQMSCTPSLVPPGLLENARKVLDKLKVGVKVTAEQAKELFEILAGRLSSDDDRFCAVCFEEITEASAKINKRCHHSFCSDCLNNLFRTSYASNVKCPLCRGPCEASDLISGSELKRYSTVEKKEENVDIAQNVNEPQTDNGLEAGAKIVAFMKDLKSIPQEEKTVAFSQFTAYLDVMEEKLKEEGWIRGKHYQRLDGKSSLSQRKKMMEQFKQDDTCRLFLISLKAGGTGINLIAANNVFMMDIWWNIAVEMQAYDRVHRIGQTKEVRVMKLIAESSIEEKVLDLQERKQLLSKAALSKLSPEEQRKARLDRFIRLFEYER